MTIAIYGTGFQADRFFEKIQIYSNVNIVYFIQTDPDKESYRGIKVICADEINCRDFDYLVVAVSDRLAHDEIMNKLRSLKVPDLDLKIKQVLDFFHVDGLKLGLTMPYKSVKTEDGLVFLSEQKDITIPEHMWYYGTVWSKSEMDLFLDLTNRFYGKISHEKWFLDIGANIGTTSIYIRKQGYRVIGFEAGSINHRLLKTNTILNDMDDIRTEHIALSDHSGDAYYYFNETNSGGSAVTDQKISSEKVQLLTLDEYLDANGICCEDIGFLWIDTEGYEARIINGAMNLLSKKRLPMWQEFSPDNYIKAGLWRRYVDDICRIYQRFIDYNDIIKGNAISYEIAEIEGMPEKMEREKVRQTDLFFF